MVNVLAKARIKKTSIFDRFHPLEPPQINTIKGPRHFIAYTGTEACLVALLGTAAKRIQNFLISVTVYVALCQKNMDAAAVK